MISNVPPVVALRPWADGDYPLLVRLLGDPAMMEHLGGPESPEKIRERQQRYLTNDSGKARVFVIVTGPEQVAAGFIGYWEKEWHGQPVWETGWSVLPEFQRQGIASKAAVLVAERARADGRRRYLHAFPSVDNAASNAVCRKAGFVLMGEAEFEYPTGHFMRCNDWRIDLSQ